jgi:tRNA threonylcarbamoyladenosine biosynthesis protein TsaE
MVLAMYGELGSGKTVLAKGIGRGLESEDEITSPSFVIMNVYSGRIPIYHFDFYRLNSILQLDDLGLDEFFYGDGVSLVEWADRLGERLPRGSIEVSLKRVSYTTDSLRQIALRSSEPYEADFAIFLEDGNVEKRG